GVASAVVPRCSITLQSARLAGGSRRGRRPTWVRGCQLESCRGGTAEGVVTLLFEPLGELEATGRHDAAVHEDVDGVRGDVVEEALVVGDDQETAIGAGQLVDAVGHDAQRVDVETG